MEALKKLNYRIIKENIWFYFSIHLICKFFHLYLFVLTIIIINRISTFVCPTEIIAFSDRIKDFKSIGAEIVGVSTDSHFSHLAWVNTARKSGGLGGLNYPLLSDFNKTISKDYDVLIDAAGIALRGWLFVFRLIIRIIFHYLKNTIGLFIIDPNGTIRQMSVNDLPVGRSVDETIRLIKAFQFVEKHGEVCPANWNPETKSATIKPDPKKSLEYFKNVE